MNAQPAPCVRPAASLPEVLHGHSDRVPDEGRAGNHSHPYNRFAVLYRAEGEPDHSIPGVLDTAEPRNVNVFDDDGFGVAFAAEHCVPPKGGVALQEYSLTDRSPHASYYPLLIHGRFSGRLIAPYRDCSKPIDSAGRG